MPSSEFLARRMVETIDFKNIDTIVEFGPGTGVFSETVLSRISPQTIFFAIEANPVMADHLRAHLPQLILYQDNATRLADYLARHQSNKADAIICGLPWASFGDDLQDELLGAILDNLKPGGQFMTFAYLQGLLLPAGQKFYRKLKAHFAGFGRSPIVWRNFPPAFVYRCIK